MRPPLQKKQGHASDGFSLIELLVVMAIVSIMAVGAVMMLTSDNAKLRSAAFNLKADINLARGSAVNTGTAVLVQFYNDVKNDFTASGEYDAYRICIDSTAANGCTDETGTNMIKEVLMEKGVQFYDTTVSVITGGPTQTQGGTSLAALDGILFSSNDLIMNSTGSSDVAGTSENTVVIYVPGTNSTMRAYPFSVSVSPSGTITLYRWMGGVWK